MDLEERQALRRVAGLSTELEDVSEVEYRQLRLERVVLVGVWTSARRKTPKTPCWSSSSWPRQRARRSSRAIQRRHKPDPATYIGSGKAQELRDVVESTGADTVICDGELPRASSASWRRSSRSRSSTAPR